MKTFFKLSSFENARARVVATVVVITMVTVAHSYGMMDNGQELGPVNSSSLRLESRRDALQTSYATLAAHISSLPTLMHVRTLTKPQKSRFDQIVLYIQGKQAYLKALINHVAEDDEVMQRSCTRQLRMLTTLFVLYKSAVLKLEMFSLGRLDTVNAKHAMQEPLSYQKRQHVGFAVLDYLFELVRNNWYVVEHELVALDQFLNESFNNNCINELVASLVAPKVEDTSWWGWFLTMFHESCWSTKKCIDFPDLYDSYSSLCEDYFGIAYQVHQKVFVNNAAVQKTLSENLVSLICSFERERDLLIKNHMKLPTKREQNYSLKDMNKSHFMKIRMLDLLCSKLFAMKDEVGSASAMVLDYAKNADKLDIIVRDQVLKGSSGFGKLLKQECCFNYIATYVQLVNEYAGNQAYSADYMVQLYTLINHLEEIKEQYVGYWSNDPLAKPLSTMIVLLKDITLEIYKKKQTENLFNQILSGEWLKNNNLKQMSILGQEGLSFEMVKRLASGDTSEFKTLAMKTLLCSSPLIGLAVLRYAAPHLSEDLRKRVITLLGGEVVDVQDAQAVTEVQVEPVSVTVPDSQAIMQLIQQNPDLLTELVNNNPELVDKVAAQVRQKIEAESVNS